MSPILSVTLQGMQAGMARVERVAMNLANAQSTGFKREALAVRPFAQALGAQALDSRMDTRQGTVKATGQPLDLALSGPGWFEVAGEQGPLHTRQGSFRLDPQGRLVTAQGRPVLGTGGEIVLQNGTPVIDAQGRVYEGVAGDGGIGRTRPEPIAQLRVVQFAPQATAQRQGDGLVSFDGQPQAAQAPVQVLQAHLENSNVDAAQEMVQLVQAMRHFESLQKVALGYDEMLGHAIRRLGESQ